jgi:hypothetical protein
MQSARIAALVLFASAAAQVLGAEPVPVAPGAGTAIAGTPAGAQGESWQSIAKLPDFTTGIWLGKMTPPDPSAAVPPPTPLDNRSCAPNGMPRVMGGPLGVEFLFTPGRVTMALEDERAIRRVYLQPRHSDDPDYTFMGESIGHWENGTLVIDTIAIKSVHETPPTRIVERMHLVGPDQLQVEQTLYYAERSSRRVRSYERRRNEHIMEYYCEENPRDQFDAGGHARVDTTQK